MLAISPALMLTSTVDGENHESFMTLIIDSIGIFLIPHQTGNEKQG